MEREVSIILVKEAKNYRKLAQQHYGLTDEQMMGMHVHHNPRRCDGGRNIPEHLYVYSPDNHDYVHGGNGFVVIASEGGKKGGTVNTNKQQQTRKNNIAKMPKSILSQNGKNNIAKMPKSILSQNGKNNFEQMLASPKTNEARKRNVRVMLSHPNTILTRGKGGRANTEKQQESRRRVAKELGIKSRIPVVCVETDDIYVSATEAGIKTNTQRSHITACCKGKRNTAGGFHWRYHIGKNK